MILTKTNVHFVWAWYRVADWWKRAVTVSEPIKRMLRVLGIGIGGGVGLFGLGWLTVFLLRLAGSTSGGIVLGIEIFFGAQLVAIVLMIAGGVAVTIAKGIASLALYVVRGEGLDWG